MTTKMTVRAVKSFSGAEGMWTRGREMTAPEQISLTRAQSLVRKGLAEEVTEGAAARQTKPAPAPTTKPAQERSGGQRAPTTRPAPPPSTKAKGKGKPAKAAKAAETEHEEPAERVEQSVIVEGLTITVPRQLFGEGDKAFTIPEAVIKGEPETDYSVFGFADGATPVAVTGDEAIEAVAAKAGAELLDVVTTGKE